MPDSSGQYLGDRATVLPSNENALLHFSTLFAQKEAQRRAQRAAQAKAEQEQLIGLNKYVGDKLDSPEFKKAYDYQQSFDMHLPEISNRLYEASKQGMSIPELYALANKEISTYRSQYLKAKALHDNNAEGIASILKQDTYVDPGALTALTVHDSAYNPDGSLKDISRVNPTGDYASQAYAKHSDKLYKPKMRAKAWDDYFNSQKLSDINEPQQYDEKGNLIRQGYDGKLPALAYAVKDANGKSVLNADGTPKLDVSGSEYYKLPGETQDYRDDKGQRVKVVNDELFKTLYYGPFKSDIENQVKPLLQQAGVSEDSDYADMLRKKLLYDKVETEATNRYKFTIPEDKSASLKNQILGRQIQQANLEISKHNSNRADQKFVREKLMQENGGDNAPEPLTDILDREKGETIHSLDGQTSRIVRVKNIDPKVLKNTLGVEYDAKGKIVPGSVEPYRDKKDAGDKGFFVVGDNGDWFGDGGQRIDREEAYKRQLDAGKKGNALIQAPPKKNVIQKMADRLKKAVTPTKKVLQGNIR